jgi:hypothetical protein
MAQAQLFVLAQTHSIAIDFAAVPGLNHKDFHPFVNESDDDAKVADTEAPKLVVLPRQPFGQITRIGMKSSALEKILSYAPPLNMVDAPQVLPRFRCKLNSPGHSAAGLNIKAAA